MPTEYVTHANAYSYRERYNFKNATAAILLAIGNIKQNKFQLLKLHKLLIISPYKKPMGNCPPTKQFNFANYH